MDVFSDILEKISLTSSFYYRASLNGQWGVDMPHEPGMARFHIVVEGDFWLKMADSDERVKVSAGDIVIVFHGEQHLMLNQKDADYQDAKVFLENADEYTPGKLLRYSGGSDKTTNIICGHFYFENSNAHPVLKHLPNLLHIKSDENSHAPWLGTILDFVDFESKLPKPGARVVVKKLTEVIFIQAIRVFLERQDGASTVLKLINDENISRSLDAIHRNPEKKWTLEELAEVAGLSRTIYSKRFKRISAMTPYTYLTQWRMELARELLRDTDKSTGEIADAVGFQADEHFQKVFKKENGLTPSQYRKNTRG